MSNDFIASFLEHWFTTKHKHLSVHDKKFICARVIFFARSPKILLILVLLLRSCHRVSCTNLGLENFARNLGLILFVALETTRLLHSSAHKSHRSFGEFALKDGSGRCCCYRWRHLMNKIGNRRLPWFFSSNGGKKSLKERCSCRWNW